LSIVQSGHSKLVEHRICAPDFAYSRSHTSFWQHRLLREYSNARTSTIAHHASVGSVVTAQDSQQCAFAAAIETNNTNAIAVAQCKRNIVKQRTIWPRGFEPLGVDQNHSFRLRFPSTTI
jgi:hypothetical protein